MENKTINKKLLEIQKRMQPVIKDAKNPFYNNAPYATLSNILSVVKPILTELGLILIQPIHEGCVVTTIADSESNEAITSSIALPVNLDAQKIGSAITYYRRYTLASLLSLEIEDDDGNAATIAPAQTQQPKQPDDNKPWLNDKACAQAIERIKTGESDVIAKCKAAFKISKANMEKLNNALNGK